MPGFAPATCACSVAGTAPGWLDLPAERLSISIRETGLS